MAVTATSPGQMPLNYATNGYTSDTVKCALVSSLASYVQDTTIFWSTLSGSDLATANGYTAGGATVGSKTTNYDSATNKNQFRGSVPAWTSSGAGFSAVGCVYYKDTGNAATSPILSVVDFGGTQTATNGGTFTITADATNGIFSITAS